MHISTENKGHIRHYFTPSDFPPGYDIEAFMDFHKHKFCLEKIN